MREGEEIKKKGEKKRLERTPSSRHVTTQTRTRVFPYSLVGVPRWRLCDAAGLGSSSTTIHLCNVYEQLRTHPPDKGSSFFFVCLSWLAPSRVHSSTFVCMYTNMRVRDHQPIHGLFCPFFFFLFACLITPDAPSGLLSETWAFRRVTRH